MKKQEPKRPRPVPEAKSSPPTAPPEQQEPEVPTFTEIGGSPVPGFTLRHVLRGHMDRIGRIAWSPDGAYIASPSEDKTIRIWDAASGACVRTLQDHNGGVNSVAWSPDGQCLASASNDKAIHLWNAASGNYLQTLKGHSEYINSVAWSPDGQRLASASADETIRLWDAASGNYLQTLRGHSGTVKSVAWSPDGKRLASASHDGTICLWDAASGKHLKNLQGHTDWAVRVEWSPDGNRLASASHDGTIRLWDTATGKALHVLEGHSNSVNCAVFSADGHWLATKGNYDDDTVRLWNCDTWICQAILTEPVWVVRSNISIKWTSDPGLAFHPRLPMLATLGERDTIIRIWELDESLLLVQVQDSAHYTTAKLVLVGDSGVGKTGLGWRIAHGEFKEHASTHGQQFWAIPQLGLKRKDGTECEAVLWDLAGQHVYRQIHSIFLENVAAALVLFDPSNRQEPLKGAQFWLEQLKGKGQLPPAVLVGARVDRGAPALSQHELEQFCQRYGIRGGYISTSAKSSEGLEVLLETLKQQIPWDEMTATVTTVTFKRIKDYVLALKEKPDREGVLVSPLALREQLQATDQDWRFTDAEMMTAVGHLETHGYVAVLRSSAGDQYILLTPDLLVTLACSIALLADKHSRELGAVSETELLQVKHSFEELAGLSQSERQILLDAAILRFLEHNICFRETLNDDNLLIFPSLIKQKRPLQDDLPSADDISYVVRGRVENLYASLVVLLGYTPSFTRINQWQNQAQYEMGEGEICGFRLIEDREGEIELVLYYGEQMPPSGHGKFQELFEQFLHQRDVEVTPFPPVVCSNKHQQKRATVVERVRERKPFMFCDECGDKITLPDFDKPQSIGIAASPWLQLEEAAARLRSAYEVQLTKVKGYRRGWAAPRCYISRLPEQAVWAEKLVRDLRDAGVYVMEEAAQVQPDDYVVLLDTSAYQRAFNTPVLAADAALIRARLDKKRQLLSLALTGQAVAHEFEDCKPGSFWDDTHYPVSLFDLALNLYAIPLTHAGFAPLRQALHTQWEQTLARRKGDDVISPLKIFISYSHKDETYKDELVTMLAGLQSNGVIDAWHDRRIEAGDEWYKSIQDAMDDCDLSLLLVSPDYLASRFIQEEEQPRLLLRRQEMQLRVIPIIVRPCKWTSEPALEDLQALPKDGKAVIRFPKANGARDQVWADIASVIEERAKAKTSP
jgi:small GTP-binding protein